MLVAATYNHGSPFLPLTFDRPINIAAFGVFVGDPTFNHTGYDGTGGAFVMDPNVVGIYLNATGEYFGTEVDLVASGATGIVAVDDGGAWAGTGGGNLFLPYP